MKSLQEDRRGFTLIELLVVIAIVAILFTLGLVAAQRVMGAAATVQCTNNLKGLAMGLREFEREHGYFPPSEYKKPDHGWAAVILRYIDQDALADSYRWDVDWFEEANEKVIATQLKLFQCPAAPPNRFDRFHEEDDKGRVKKSGTAAVSDYFAPRGIHKDMMQFGYIDRVPEERLAGVIAKRDDKHPTISRMADVRDGASFTIMLAECHGRPDFIRMGRIVPEFDKKGKEKINKGGSWAAKENGFDIHGSLFDGTRDDKVKSGPCVINCTNDKNVYSLHSGGANFAFADGSVRFLQQTIDVRIFAALITRNGGEPVSPGDF